MRLAVLTGQSFANWAKAHKVPDNEIQYTIEELERMDEPRGNSLNVPIFVGGVLNLRRTYFQLTKRGECWDFTN